MAFLILELADELILSIFEHIDDRNTLRSLALTCSRLQGLAEPYVYRDIFLRSRTDAFALGASIVSRPERLRAVRRIEARLKYGMDECRLDILVNIVRQALNLQELTLESPFCNNVQGRAQQGWDESLHSLLRPVCDFAIPRLTTLTLHLSLEDDRYWTVDQSKVMMFAHPTLESLKLSCATLKDDLVSLLQDRPRSPLKHLALVECNITQKALTSILAIPAALERLSIGENFGHRRPWPRDPTAFNLLVQRDPIAFLASLKPQRHSLRSLGYAMWEPVSGTPPPAGINVDADTYAGLSDFSNLHELSLQGCSAEFRRLLESPRTAPPNLQRLSFVEPKIARHITPQVEGEGQRQSVPWCTTLFRSIPSLQLLEIVCRNLPETAVQAFDSSIGDRLWGKDVHIRLLKRSSWNSMPPFLYGEHLYADEEMYNWRSGRFLRDVPPDSGPICKALEYS